MRVKEKIQNFKEKIFPEKILVRDVRKQIEALQNTITVLSTEIVKTLESTRTGNPYNTSDTAIDELSKKYEGTATWGNQQARNIIDVRAAFIVGSGIKAVSKKKDGKSTRELEFIQEFIQRNDLDEEMPQELAKEGEIEGRFLGRLFFNEDDEQIDLRHLSYSTYKYKVIADKNDYKKYISVNYKDKDNKDINITDSNEFIYKRLCGRVNKVNDMTPKVAMVLRQMEDLDKALWDYRHINNLFSSPTPYFKCATKEEAESLYNRLKEANWKIGKFFCGTAEFSMVSADTQGLEGLKEEIIALAKIISGATGIPVHFLGLPDLMSNRAVSTDLFEFIMASTVKERKLWKGIYEEIFRKVLMMANDKLQKDFDVDSIEVELPYVTDAKIKEIVETWLPLYLEDVIDLDYLLSKIPDIDAQKIKNQKENNTPAKDKLKVIKEGEKEEKNIDE